MLKKDWLELPEQIRIFVLEDLESITRNITSKFDLAGGQEVFVLDLEDDIILKKINILDLPNHLDKMPNAGKVDVRLLALDLAYKVFWPLQDYLENVDRLILRLGGKVPRQKTLKVNSNKSDNNIFEGDEHSTVNKLLNDYENFEELRLTANKIINKDGRTVSPTIKNWIEDYVHFLGAGDHNSLERARYLSKSPNVLQSSDKEKVSLRYFFVSYDDDVPMFFKLAQGILTVTEANKEKKQNKADKDIVFDSAGLLDHFYEQLKSIDQNAVAENIIMSEVENNIGKINDVLWQAMGIGDKDKTVGCLKALIVRRVFDAMIKDDNRFKNILKRFVGIKYGQIMEKAIDDGADKLIIRRLFLEMVLVDKLKLSPDDVYATAFYLSNLIPGSGQVVYLDKKTGHFKWLDLQVVANKFAWVDKI